MAIKGNLLNKYNTKIYNKKNYLKMKILINENESYYFNFKTIKYVETFLSKFRLLKINELGK